MTTIRLTRHQRPAAVASPAAVPAHRGSPGAVEDPRGQVRLALLTQAAATRTTLDGAWWPHSRNLSLELPALIEELHRRGVRVTRVAYNLEGWDPAPTRLTTDGRTVRLGWFTRLDPHSLSLTGDLTRPRVDLLVTPPETTEVDAGQAFAAATTPGNDRSPTALLAGLAPTGLPTPRPPSPRRPADAATNAWESEGGHADA
jgi:hypothetical protein